MISIKNNKYLVSIGVILIISGCGSTGDYVNTEENVSSTSTQNDTTPVECSSILPQTLNNTIPKDFSVDDEKGSDDDGKGSDDDSGFHNQGTDCTQCHRSDFNSGATVFTTLNAASGSLGAAGYKIQLGDTMIYRLGRGDGNSYLTNFNGGSYTAHVIDSNGNIVNSSALNSHDGSRLDCNRCHTAGGAAGAPGRIVNYKLNTDAIVPTDTNTNTNVCVSFSSHVMPILTAKCKSCHGSNGNFTIGSANDTYANIGNLSSPMTVAAQYVIDKGTNTIGHGGGVSISPSSQEYTTIKAWINEGALNN